jgi:hypothetical protein
VYRYSLHLSFDLKVSWRRKMVKDIYCNVYLTRITSWLILARIFISFKCVWTPSLRQTPRDFFSHCIIKATGWWKTARMVKDHSLKRGCVTPDLMKKRLEDVIMIYCEKEHLLSQESIIFKSRCVMKNKKSYVKSSSSFKLCLPLNAHSKSSFSLIPERRRRKMFLWNDHETWNDYLEMEESESVTGILVSSGRAS